MVKDVAVALSVEVEVGVVGQIDDSLPVAPGSQSQLKGILIAPHVMGYHFQIAGIAGLSVLGKIHELHGIPFDTALPDLVLETVGTAVQMVGTIVHGQFVLRSFKGKTTLGYSVGIAARTFAGTGTIPEIGFRGRIAKHDICKFSIPVRNADAHDSGTDAAEADNRTLGILHCVEENFLTVGGSSPQFLSDVHI